MPAFMKPMMSMQLKNRLDANTTTRLQFQKKQQGKAAAATAANHNRVSSDLPAIKDKASRPPSIRVSTIHDNNTFGETSSESLASKGGSESVLLFSFSFYSSWLAIFGDNITVLTIRLLTLFMNFVIVVVVVVVVVTAAGFANGEEAVNMSAALAGMGPIPKTPTDARPRPVLA